MIICGNEIPRVSEFVKAREEEFGLLLVSKKTPILALNEDSKLIWECINGKRTILQIAEHINATYDVNDSYKIVECFVESCYELRLVEFI
ncbi:MAG: PqqD family protein [Clostridium sp.]|nr:PqqD family protein [Clostridium sp.]